MDIDSPIEYIRRIFPQLPDDISTGECLSWIGREKKENVVFLAGKQHWYPLYRYIHVGSIDDESTEDDVFQGYIARPFQHCLDASQDFIDVECISDFVVLWIVF